MDWRKTLKKLEKAKTADIRGALEALDAERETLEGEIADLAQRQEAADLARATGEQGEDASKLSSDLEERRSTLRGLESAREKLESALQESEERERQQRKDALLQERQDLQAERDKEWQKAMTALAEAMLHIWNARGGMWMHPSLVTGLSHWDISRDPTWKQESERLRSEAREMAIKTRLQLIEKEREKV